MPLNANVSAAANAWTQVTANNAVAVTLSFPVIDSIVVMATVDTTPPSASSTAGLQLIDGTVASRRIVLAEAFPGLTAPVRLWVRPSQGISVFVSHD